MSAAVVHQRIMARFAHWRYPCPRSPLVLRVDGMWAADRWRDGGTVTLEEVMTAVEQHHAHMAPLVGGLAGATDDVVAQQLINWVLGTLDVADARTKIAP